MFEQSSNIRLKRTKEEEELPISRLVQKTFHQLRRGPLNDQDPIDNKSMEEKRCDSCGAIEDTLNSSNTPPTTRQFEIRVWQSGCRILPKRWIRF